jgi:uncharacterized membrane protein
VSNFIVAIFPTEKQADEGRKALNELQDEGQLTIHGMASSPSEQTAKSQ